MTTRENNTFIKKIILSSNFNKINSSRHTREHLVKKKKKQYSNSLTVFETQKYHLKKKDNLQQ